MGFFSTMEQIRVLLLYDIIILLLQSKRNFKRLAPITSGGILRIKSEWKILQFYVILYVLLYHELNKSNIGPVCSKQFFYGPHKMWRWTLYISSYCMDPFGNKFLKGHWTSSTSSPTFFPKTVGIFIPLDVLAWVKTTCQVLHSRLTYFWRNMNISNIFYFSKSTSINTQYSSIWGTLKMMLFTKYLIKWKRIGRISWNFRYWFDFKSSIELDIKRWCYSCPMPLYHVELSLVDDLVLLFLLYLSFICFS